MTGYSAKIKEASVELTAKQKVQFTDTSDCIKLDEATQKGELYIDPMYWAVIAIHNEKSDNKDYDVYVIVDQTGVRYTTGSEAFWSSFRDIYDQMKDITDEDWQVKVYRKDSKNYSGKQFLTCSIV